MIKLCRKFGLTSRLVPNLPLALGASDLTLVEHTSAFTTFPNDGVHMSPRMVTRVTNYDGRLIDDFPAEVTDAIPDPRRGLWSPCFAKFSIRAPRFPAGRLPRSILWQEKREQPMILPTRGSWDSIPDADRRRLRGVRRPSHSGSQRRGRAGGAPHLAEFYGADYEGSAGAGFSPLAAAQES